MIAIRYCSRNGNITHCYLPKRPKPTGYVRPPRELFHEVPDHAATLA